MRLALTGDVMLGRRVWEAIEREGLGYPWRAVSSVLASADLRLINLEFAITGRESRWDGDPGKLFYFRAPPPVVGSLALAGVDFASVANNHCEDFRVEGLLDTCASLRSAGIAFAGAGVDVEGARRPAVLAGPGGVRVSVVAMADYPSAWAAGERTPGLNYVDLASGDGLGVAKECVRRAREVGDIVVVSCHWGPNWRERPTPDFQTFARGLIEAGADLFWGHSAHVVQGVEYWRGRPILYDTGDFVDDYRLHRPLRNDLSGLFFVDFDGGGVTAVRVLPTKIVKCRAEPARGLDLGRFARRFAGLCAEMGSDVKPEGGWLVVRAGEG